MRKNPHAQALGRKGGKARAKKLTAEKRTEIARRAVQERWRRYYARKAAEESSR